METKDGEHGVEISQSWQDIPLSMFCIERSFFCIWEGMGIPAREMCRYKCPEVKGNLANGAEKRRWK